MKYIVAMESLKSLASPNTVAKGNVSTPFYPFIALKTFDKIAKICSSQLQSKSPLFAYKG